VLPTITLAIRKQRQLTALDRAISARGPPQDSPSFRGRPGRSVHCCMPASIGERSIRCTAARIILPFPDR
jgi:hypothetical protein